MIMQDRFVICHFSESYQKNVGQPSYQEIKGVKHYFDDKEVLREAFGE